MAEGPALEKRYPVKNGIVGSNPTLSARKFNKLNSTLSLWLLAGRLQCVDLANSQLQQAKGILVRQNHGEMSELAEGARLEIVCAAKSGTEGSNPSLSATF